LEAFTFDQHLFREFLAFLKWSRRERKEATDKKKSHGAVDEPSLE